MYQMEEIPRRDWSKILKLFTNKHPRGVVGHALLDTQLNHTFRFMDFRVFGCMDENKKDYHGMVGLNQIKTYQELIVEPIGDLKILEEALDNISLDFQDDLVIAYIDSDVHRLMERFYLKHGFQIEAEYAAIKQYYCKEFGLFEGVSTPPKGTKLGKLKLEHLELVDETWPYNNEGSRGMFRDLIENNLTYALYTEDDQLTSWVTINEAGAYCHLYSLEEYRRRGHAEFLIKHVTNQRLLDNKPVLVFTDDANVKSIKLFRKLGFRIIGWGVWLFLKR